LRLRDDCIRIVKLNQVATVYINGNQAGKPHIGGYLPFAYDITGFLSKSNTNQLAVKLTNAYDDAIPPLSADFNFYGGIYRDVYLIITNPIHFDMLNMGSTGVFINTPDVSVNSATISARLSIVNQSKTKEQLTIRNTLLDANRNPVKQSIVKLKIDSGAQKETKSNLIITNPQLWSPENPNLYTLVSEIVGKDGLVYDRVENPVGLRWFNFDPQKGFFINGKQTKLIGSNRHQDYQGRANALTNEMHRYDMKLLKEMGINFIRISHYPQDPAVLEMCDRYGFVATLEIPFVNETSLNENFMPNTVNMMREAIRVNYNHPCLVALGTGNETTMKNQQASQEYLQQLTKTHIALYQVVKEEDSARYSYSVFFRSPEYNQKLNIRQTDLIGHNMYVGWYYGTIDEIKNNLPLEAQNSLKIDSTKPFILSEYGAGSDPRIRSFNPTRFDFSMEYQVLLHKEHLRVILNTPEIVGSNI
jgi:beta-galactosidase